VDCAKYVYGENGELSTYYEVDKRLGAKPGDVVELPMTRDADDHPPCGQCPKHREGEKDPKPLAEEDDFAPWFWDVLDWFDEGRVFGFGEANELMRAVGASVGRFERGQDRRASTAGAEIIAAALRR
jgi:hypothetical protein